MAYYNTCPKCGSNLDPGEKCDCEREKVMEHEFFNRHLKTESKGGQIVFALEEGNYEKKMCI